MVGAHDGKGNRCFESDRATGLWSANSIKPHVIRTFKLSNDKNFEKKFWDVIGLYLNPPDRALGCCVVMKRASARHWNVRNPAFP